ncbi:MAG: glycosidase [Haloquadratum sp. J07HQX50]|nr:MAG: glycosidase [Haloquadratum sp. J07HQX50]
MARQTPSHSHHPGPPRFLQVGERIADPIFVDMAHGFDRDNLAPTIAGDPERNPENYHKDAFSWRLSVRPPDSSATIKHTLTAHDDGERYDHGLHHTAEFEPDEPGRYIIQLHAPDGMHELTLQVFDGEMPAGAKAGTTHQSNATSGLPRINLRGHYDSETATFIIDSNPAISSNSHAHESELIVEFLPHDASELETTDMSIESTSAQIPAAALDGPTSIYAAPFDGQRVGVRDQIVLDPESETVSLPNRPPDWLDDAVMYEIFTRSFAGAPGETTFGTLTDRVTYLDSLGVDVVWLTPIIPAWSPTVDRAPGGPHGYSATDYFDIADDLGTLADFETFVDHCHDHNIRVCFDLVINHCGWPHPFFQDTIEKLGPTPQETGAFPAIESWDTDSQYFDWFDRQRGATSDDAAPAQTSFFDVRYQPNLNFDNIALREHALAVVEFWAERVDGFRCDIAWGVPHSFWTEVRERVHAINSEFFLLGEAIPRTAAFAASEFDCHFDTTGFTETAHAIARGERPPRDLLQAIAARRHDGFPRYTRVLNATENHDEARLGYEATTGHREAPAHAQRAAAAAAFTLPGIPMIYYGQERRITEHGQRRQPAYADDPDRCDDIESDPYKRAFMNWSVLPTDHFNFYQRLISYYQSSDVLGPEAELMQVAYDTKAATDIVAFGRDAGAQKRLVVVNFAAEPRRVDLRSVVDTNNRFTQHNIGVACDDNLVTIEVDTLAILTTPTLLGQRYIS